MNVKYAIILASGLSSTVAVMSQAAPLTNGDIDSPSQDAMILPMEESKVSVVYDPKTSVVFTDEGIKGTSDGLTLDLERSISVRGTMIVFGSRWQML